VDSVLSTISALGCLAVLGALLFAVLYLIYLSTAINSENAKRRTNRLGPPMPARRVPDWADDDDDNNSGFDASIAGLVEDVDGYDW
jgi:hypothetical protein